MGHVDGKPGEPESGEERGVGSPPSSDRRPKRREALVARVDAAFERFGIAGLVALVTVVVLPLIVVWPWLTDMSTYGFHDWDAQTSHRYLVKKSIVEYHQFPGWNPYACGGFPAWGYVESGTIVVSPWLPFYLFGDMRVALRIEVLGMALAGALGTYLLATRFTKSHAARALVVALFAVNGRWALQAAAGHTWHLAYAFTPWCWYFFERARARGRRVRDLALLGAGFAALIYSGAIYPLPHTLLLLGLWALGLVVIERSLRPIVTLGVGGVIGLGLSAPKLLPLLATFKKAPRVIESTEQLDLGAFITLLTSRNQAFYSRPAKVAPYGWHEWGMYIGGAGAALLVLGLLFTKGKREGWLKIVGLLFVALGFGSFHEYAPWPFLHAHAPVFGSQHVPSRFLYPAVLVLAIVVASGLGRWVTRRSSVYPWLDPLLTGCVLAIGVDIALVARKPMKDAMWMEAPDIPSDQPFSQVENPIYNYKRRDWAGPIYLSMLGNTGIINCYGAPPFEGKGALSRRDPRYRGEAVIEPGGKAQVTRWTPNEVEISADSTQDGALVVYNTNFDEGFRATVTHDGVTTAQRPSKDHDRLAAPVPLGHSTVTFTYSPPRMGLGLVLAGITVAGVAAAWLLERRSRG